MAENEQRPEGPLTASVAKLRHELDHWMEVALSQGEKALEAVGLRGADGPWCPSIDIVETVDSVVVTIDLPSVDPNGIDVALAGNMLTVSGEKAATSIADNETCHTAERATGSFKRPIPLPVPVNPDSVSAEMQNGTMCITLAKADEAKSRQITVNSGSES
jgi:HSP20 family protein